MKSRRFILVIVAISLSIFLTSCYSEYISLHYKVKHGAMWNDDETQIAFFVSKKAYRAPKGIARFPDGGISKTVFSEQGLYVFNPENKSLYEVLAAKSFPSDGMIKIAYTDSLIYYSIFIDLEYRLRFAETEADSLGVYRLKERYSKPFVVNVKTRVITNVDSSTFLKVYREDKKVDYMTLHNQVSEVPLSELGLVIKDIYPKSDKEYITETIYLKNNSRISRRAVVEQIIAKLSKEEIRGILLEMDNYLNSLEGYSKSTYQFYSRETYEQIQTLL